ncbi:EthD family reductase [Alicyclobacillus tolerans]|uniref:EthD family reductase n=1 Tax=Alicyclobacillus tolerans TaxID=90970 RepID=UPI001F003617|nr:EthD family reductase [Alicyclobacillus tolerans]MCF8568080.1 EthD family reductase [Alicyclobacillus tolerans]
MIKLIAMYRPPSDPAAFDEHYDSIHTPLVRKIPGLKKLEVTRMVGTPDRKAPAYYLMAQMYFENNDAFKAAMTSPENKAAGKDLMGFAGDIAEFLIGESEEDG